MELITFESQTFKALQEHLNEIREELEKRKMESIEDTWLSSKQVQKVLGISQKTWQTYRDRNMIKFSQVGQKIYVRVNWLEEFMEEHTINRK